MANKIKYGLRNVYYAIATIGTDGTASYDSPVAFPGAVSLSIEPQGETSPFYADNIVYYTSISNTGYEGDLEMARIIDSFKTDVLGEIADDKNVYLEDAGASPIHFALMFQFEGDESATRHVLYNCVATRTSLSGSTKTESIEPQTETVSLTAASVYFSSIQKDIVKASTSAATDSTTYNGWNSTVYTPTVTATTT